MLHISRGSAHGMELQKRSLELYGKYKAKLTR